MLLLFFFITGGFLTCHLRLQPEHELTESQAPRWEEPRLRSSSALSGEGRKKTKKKKSTGACASQQELGAGVVAFDNFFSFFFVFYKKKEVRKSLRTCVAPSRCTNLVSSRRFLRFPSEKRTQSLTQDGLQLQRPVAEGLQWETQPAAPAGPHCE